VVCEREQQRRDPNSDPTPNLQQHARTHARTYLHIHSENTRVAGRRRPNVAQTNDRQGLSSKLASTKHALVLFHTLLGHSLGSQLLHVVDTIHNPPRSQQHAAENEFLDGIGVGPRRVKDGNAQLGHARHGNVVGPGTATGNGAHRHVHFRFLQFVRAQNEGVRRTGSAVGGLDRVEVAGEARQTNG